MVECGRGLSLWEWLIKTYVSKVNVTKKILSMEKEKHVVKIGQKALIYESDNNQDDKEFVNEFNQVAASNPTSIQDFFIRLAELQRRKSSRIVSDETTTGRKKSH
jgi:hypothetical protein